MVGNIQGEVADTMFLREEFEMIVVADQIAVGLAGADLLEGPFLVHFEDAGRGDKKCEVRSAKCGIPNVTYSVTIFFGVFKLAVHRFDTAFERRFELREVPHEDDQARVCRSRSRPAGESADVEYAARAASLEGPARKSKNPGADSDDQEAT